MSSSHGGSSGSRAGVAVIVAAIAFLLFLVAWLGGWLRPATDPRVIAIQQLQEDSYRKFAANGGPQSLEEAKEAVKVMRQIREQVESLPEPLQQQAEAGGGGFRKAFWQRVDNYFATPPEKRTAELDRQLRQDELMRQAFEAVGGGGGGAGRGSIASGTASSRGSGGGPPGGGRARTEEDRNRWRKSMIDRTTPRMRARYAEYRSAMEKRRQEIGLPAGGPR